MNVKAAAFAQAEEYETPDPWGAEPEPLKQDAAPAEPYPMVALGPLERAVRAIIDMTRVPPALAAQSVLAAASLAAQAHADVETLDGAKPLSLFLLTVAESGERKSAADRRAMVAVRDREAALRDAYEHERRQYDRALTVWHAERKAIEKQIEKDPKDPATRADLEALRPEPEPPLLPNLIAGDPTLEGLQRLFAEGSPSLGLFSDEGGQFLGGYSMSADHRSKTISGLCRFWDGTPTDRTRAKDGARVLVGKRLAQHLMLQPVIATDLFADEIARGQGYLARCLLSQPESTMGTRFHREPAPESAAALTEHNAALGSLLRRDPPLREGKRNELDLPTLRLHQGARDLLIGYADATERAMGADGDLRPICAFAAKSAEQAARMAGVLSLYADPDATEINAEMMGRATELAQYYLGEALRLIDAATVDKELKDADALWQWLKGFWPGWAVGPTDIAQNGPRCSRTTKATKRLMRVLQEHGYVREIEGGAKINGRRARTAWEIHGRRQ